MRTHGWAGSTPADNEAAVKRILDGAASLIEEGRAVSVQSVARQVGITRQTLYRYFPDAESIQREVAREASADLLAGLATALADVVDPAEAVVEGIATCYELLRDNRRFALLFDRSGSGGVLEDVTSESAVGAGRAILGSLGVDWQQAGWDDDDLDRLVEFMLRMLISLIVDPGDRAQTREALRNFLDRWVAPAVACKRGDWIRV